MKLFGKRYQLDRGLRFTFDRMFHYTTQIKKAGVTLHAPCTGHSSYLYFTFIIFLVKSYRLQFLLLGHNMYEVKKMKLNKDENKSLSDAIDQIQDGLNTMIEMYNESEDDKFLINFDDEVVQGILKAKKIFGDETVDKKINTLVHEVISFLPLHEYEEKQEDALEVEDEDEIGEEE